MKVSELIAALKRAPKTAEIAVYHGSDKETEKHTIEEAYPHRYYGRDGKWKATEFDIELGNGNKT